MNITTEKVAESRFDPGEFLTDSGLMLNMQQAALKANLRRVSNAHGFEIVKFAFRNRNVLFTAYIGDDDGERINLRCRSTVCRLLRAAGAQVSANKLHVRYRHAVVRVACTPDWN